jgi:hypothetical protein
VTTLSLGKKALFSANTMRSNALKDLAYAFGILPTTLPNASAFFAASEDIKTSKNYNIKKFISVMLEVGLRTGLAVSTVLHSEVAMAVLKKSRRRLYAIQSVILWRMWLLQ